MLGAHQILFFESPLLTVGVCLLAMIAGQAVGSVAHRIAWRLTHGASALAGGARCRACGHAFTPRESLPLLGWVLMRGTCPYCGEQLWVDKPACELLSGFVFASVVLRHGLGLQAVEVLALVSVLLVICLSSLWDYRIPNSCIAAAVAVRAAYLLALALTRQDAVSLAVTSLVGALVLGLPLALSVFLSNAMLARDVSGMGTVKLVGVVGLYLGWQQGLFALAGACALWLFVWLLSPSKVLEVEVAGGPQRGEGTAEDAALNPRDLRATLEEDIAEPMRLIPLAPPVAIMLWVLLLLGVTPALWSSPIF